jgi:flavin reductase (DIM6/NTAB) family NADH-FMN oxidoreductase RutF
MGLRLILPGQLDPVQTGALLTGGVGPRPIALASTCAPDGVRNLAPFSFFNAFGSNPPMVAFAPNRRGRDGTLKDTYRNAVATGEFVIAAVTHAMLQQMNIASAEYPEGVDEFGKSGLTPLPAARVRPALVAESPFQLECRLDRALELGQGPGSGLLLLGEVLAFHVNEACLAEGALDPGLLDLVGRQGGAWYVRCSGPALFQRPKPEGRPMGYDALPAPLRASGILTGNDLGLLAHRAEPPDPSAAEARPGDPADVPGLERAAQAALGRGDPDEAWRLLGLRLRLG